MQNDHSNIYDVIIAGAGPVGLFLACELRLAGCSVLVLEQANDASSPLKKLPFGMRGLSVPTIEAFYRRGLLADLVSQRAAKPENNGNAPNAAHWMSQQRRPGGHFAGIQFFLDNIDTAKWLYRLPNPGETNMSTDMESVETVLAGRASEMSVEIRRGRGVQHFDQSGEEVVIQSGEEIFYARWLVGCDGGHSTVRKVAGFDFIGTNPEFTGYSVQIGMADSEELTPGRHYTPTGMYTYQKPGIVAMVDFDGGVVHRTKSITREHVQAVLRRISNTNVTVTALHLGTTWTDRAYQVTSYKKGKVLLAGDAAHIHSPLGGQGLNLGLGDAMNLGWKLAATIRGDAPAGLLDSYSSERHPTGAQILDWSRAQVAIMRPSPSARALAAIMRDLIDTPDGATYLAERVWGISHRYDLGDSHPLVGRSAPDFALADGLRLGDHLKTGKGILLDFDTQMPLQALASGWANRITYATSDTTDNLGLNAMLVRPDGYVAWVSETAIDYEQLSKVAAKWFG